ncbi:choline/ethanolamine transporter flvcr2b isoform X2 [Leptinotarsa decemlineata]|uniref:choline/ethanolamine transporter flvcr2b isoform X2 n=1 Tax=Leptinotarsa decemlineata TaxID=7539 RepID=UPI003D305FB7
MEEETLKEPGIQPVIRAYRKRWIILIIYISCICISTFQWIEYSIITNIVMKYYHVSATMVDWTSISFMIIWPIFIFPASYIIDKMGLRVAAFIGIVTTALGAGQTIVSFSQTFLLNLPSKLTVAWFKFEEVSTACSLGIMGSILGVAFSFYVPPILVKDSDNLDDIAADLRVMCWSVFLVSMPLVLIVYFYFPKEPVHPPSIAMFEERINKKHITFSIFVKSIKILIKNKFFLLHLVAFGCNYGVYSVIGTLLNQIVLNYFPGTQEDVGKMGLIMIISGIGGSLITGYILDKTHKFKETSIIIFLSCAISLGAIWYALTIRNKMLTYLAIAVFGFFLNAYLPAGMEFGTEIAYPSPESTIMGLVYATAMTMSVILTIIFGKVLTSYGSSWCLFGMIAVSILGCGLTILTPNTLKRQEAYQKSIHANYTQILQGENNIERKL